MSPLNSMYEQTKLPQKLPFDLDQITDVLMADPIKLDVSQILHTPMTVVVKLPKQEYMKLNIPSIVSRKFDVEAICKDDMLIFE